MTLSKQLVSMLALLFLLLFTANFVLSINNIKHWLEGEAGIHAQNTATSLGLSLSPHLHDEQDPLIESMMLAMFDRGYYKEISLNNVDGKALVVLTDDSVIPDVPAWFIDWFPMQPATAESEISSGWQISGTLSVTINPGFAYRKLYQQVKSTLLYSSVAFVVVSGLSLLLIQLILASLKRLEKMTLSLAGGQFITLDQMPRTTEIRHLTLAMNDMSLKLGMVVNKLQNELTQAGERLLHDDLTGLPKRSLLESDIEQPRDQSAALYYLRLDCLTEFSSQQGDEVTDRFVQSVADALRQFCLQCSEHAQAYRLQGAEFAVLTPQSQGDIEQSARDLSNMLDAMGQQYQLADLGHIGVLPVTHTSDAGVVLAAAIEAYEQACLIGQNSFFVQSDGFSGRDIASWHDLIDACIERHQFELTYPFTIADVDNEQILMREMYVQPQDAQGGELPVSVFIALAEKSDRIVRLEQAVLERYFQSDHLSETPVAINLSFKTIAHAGVRNWLRRNLKKHAASTKNLVFSLTAYSAGKSPDISRDFIEFAHQFGIKVIIKRFAPQSMTVQDCISLKPDYIRLAQSVVSDIAQDSEKQRFVRSLVEVGELLNVAVLAEVVTAAADFDTLKQLGIKGASR